MQASGNTGSTKINYKGIENLTEDIAVSGFSKSINLFYVYVCLPDVCAACIPGYCEVRKGLLISWDWRVEFQKG